MAALGNQAEIDFRTLRELLEADDSVLSKAVSHLDKLGYVTVTKGYAGNRPRTWVKVSAQGQRAFQQHLLALRAISEGFFAEPHGARSAADGPEAPESGV